MAPGANGRSGTHVRRRPGSPLEPALTWGRCPPIPRSSDDPGDDPIWFFFRLPPIPVLFPAWRGKLAPPIQFILPLTSNGHERGLQSSIFDDLEGFQSCARGATFHIGFRSRGRRLPAKNNEKPENLGKCSRDLPGPSRTHPVPGTPFPGVPGPRGPGSPGPRVPSPRVPGSKGPRGPGSPAHKKVGWGVPSPGSKKKMGYHRALGMGPRWGIVF